MTNKEYRAAPGISRSELFILTQSPLHFKYALEHPEEETAALAFGTAAHTRILEPTEFSKRYTTIPKIDRRTKEGRELFQRWNEDTTKAGKQLISKEDHEVIEEMAAAIESNPLAVQLLKGEHEKSFFWNDPETGIKCKCRPDCLTEYEGHPLIVDYKTTDSCADGHFERSCKKYGYRLQAGMYTEGLLNCELKEYGFAFVAQEKKAPYAVRVYFCSPDFIARGYDDFRALLGIYKWCCDNNRWYGYEGPEGIATELFEEV